jgi:putative oxidoreductase
MQQTGGKPNQGRNHMGSWREAGRSLGLLLLRVMGGAGIAVHGYDKLFGGHIDMFAKMAVAPMGFPMPLVFAYFAGMAEFLGGIFIAVGLLTRLASIPLLFNMCVAVFMVHVKHGDPVARMEPALAYLTVAATLLLAGPGSISLDRIILGKKK